MDRAHLAGHLVFDEVITLMAVVGMVLVISGMLLANGRCRDGLTN